MPDSQYVWWESSLEVAKADEPATLIAKRRRRPRAADRSICCPALKATRKFRSGGPMDITAGIAAEYLEKGADHLATILTL